MPLPIKVEIVSVEIEDETWGGSDMSLRVRAVAIDDSAITPENIADAVIEAFKALPSTQIESEESRAEVWVNNGLVWAVGVFGTGEIIKKDQEVLTAIMDRMRTGAWQRSLFSYDCEMEFDLFTTYCEP